MDFDHYLKLEHEALRGEEYIAVDWGTSNRRAWLVGPTGQVAAKYSDDLGLKSVAQGAFGQAVDQIREKLGDHPMLLAGMIGSNLGWHEVPYQSCPVNADALASSIHWIEFERTGIVPGVCQTLGHADVMRGEEIQVLGALVDGLVPPNACVCHPGTHTKWVRLIDGKISRFQTMMTGEIFGLLKSSSILAGQLRAPVARDASFSAGLVESNSGAPLLSALFSGRARHLLQQPPALDSSFVSGLLIGSDVSGGLQLANENEEIFIVGRSDLSELYSLALSQAGRTSVIVDDHRAFLAGIRAIVNLLSKGQST